MADTADTTCSKRARLEETADAKTADSDTAACAEAKKKPVARRTLRERVQSHMSDEAARIALLDVGSIRTRFTERVTMLYAAHHIPKLHVRRETFRQMCEARGLEPVRRCDTSVSFAAFMLTLPASTADPVLRNAAWQERLLERDLLVYPVMCNGDVSCAVCTLYRSLGA
jgi:hypothetical protein